MVANTGGPVMCLDAGSRISYPGSGTTWTDLSGNGNTGTLVNGPTYSSANSGSLLFDGSNDYAQIPVNSNLQFSSNDFAISIILNFSSLSGYKTIIGNYYGGSGAETWVLQSITNTGRMAFYINGGNASLTSSDVFLTNEFSFLTCSRASGVMTMYKNQTAIASGTVGTMSSSASNIFLSSVSAHYFNGLISSVSIYNRALSAAEVSQNFYLLRGRYGV